MKNFNIEIKGEDFAKIFHKAVATDKCPKKLTDLIVGYLSRDRYVLENIFKAIMGSYPEFKYKVGDFVYVSFTDLPTWRMDRDKTLALPGVVEGNFIPCEIYEMDVFTDTPYHIKYKGVKTSDTEPSEDVYRIEARHVHSKVEDLEELEDNLENIKFKEDDTLPF